MAGKSEGTYVCRETGRRLSFTDWFRRLQRAGWRLGFTVNSDDPESYREYFDDGDSPDDVIALERSYADG